MIHRIDITGTETSQHGTNVVKGDVYIRVEDLNLVKQIDQLYRETDLRVYELMNGHPYPTPNDNIEG